MQTESNKSIEFKEENMKEAINMIELLIEEKIIKSSVIDSYMAFCCLKSVFEERKAIAKNYLKCTDSLEKNQMYLVIAKCNEDIKNVLAL